MVSRLRLRIVIVVVAALKWELAAVRKIKSSNFLFLETGIRAENATRSLESFLAKHSVQMVWNIGFAGALSHSLRVGDLLIPDDQVKFDPAIERLNSEGLQIRHGVPVSTDRILWRAEEKRALLQTEKLAWVDLESSAIAALCAHQNVPCLILRCISDSLNENLPLDLNSFFGADGHIASKNILKAIIRQPSALPSLFKLRQKSNLCAQKLAACVTRLESLLA
jgi:nucleoside phosphorylase